MRIKGDILLVDFDVHGLHMHLRAWTQLRPPPRCGWAARLVHTSVRGSEGQPGGYRPALPGKFDPEEENIY